MSSVASKLSHAERLYRRAWLGVTVDRRFGTCSTCGRFRYLGRQLRRRVYECFDCWQAGQ